MLAVSVVLGFFAIVVVQAVVESLALWGTLRRFATRSVSYRRAVLAVLLAHVGFFVAYAVMLAIPRSPFVEGVFFVAVALAARIVPLAMAVAVVCRVTAKPTFAGTSSVILVGFALSWVVPLIATVFAEPFKQAANPMAPTVLGSPVVGVCPRCDCAAYGSASLSDPEFGPVGPVICERFHLNNVSTEELTDSTITDRVLVAKYARPQRWDVVAYRRPNDPSLVAIHRVVGLPGEHVFIEDGQLWIDGVKQLPPAELAGLTYQTSDKPDRSGAGYRATRDAPARLKDDEFFLLGDFTTWSYDSRYWHAADPTMSPYAVRDDAVLGVVALTYWPPTRWRVFR